MRKGPYELPLPSLPRINRKETVMSGAESLYPRKYNEIIPSKEINKKRKSTDAVREVPGKIMNSYFFYLERNKNSRPKVSNNPFKVQIYLSDF